MTVLANGRNKSAASVADDVAAAEANLRAAQKRLAVARERYAQSAQAQEANANGAVYGAPSATPSPSGMPTPGAMPYANAPQYSQPQPSGVHHATYVPASARAVNSAPGAGVRTSKDHIAAGLFALFLGMFGIHKFYMGKTNVGFIMLGITIVGSLLTFGAAALVMQLIAVVEGVIYLVKSQEEFEREYIYGKRSWF